MATLANKLWQIRCPRRPMRLGWHGSACARMVPSSIRNINTIPQDDHNSIYSSTALFEPIQIPYQSVKHARAVPVTPSYFSREPQFNDLYIRLSNLLRKYRHLPTVAQSEAPQTPWTALDAFRAQLGEPIKASHYNEVLRVAKRLNLIEPTLRPADVKLALQRFARATDPTLNKPRPIEIDNFGRAVAVGKRKESTARAFVVEGNGEVLVNGKPLNEAFGRVHDRESAVWALTSTGRLDKYNVWILVEGGGLTGQAEASALAIAKALVVHEPRLKPALRQGT